MKKILCLIVALILAVASFSAVLVNAEGEIDVDAYVNGLIDGSLSFWDIDYYSMTEEQIDDFDAKMEAYTSTLTEEEQLAFAEQIGLGSLTDEDETDDMYALLAIIFFVAPETIEADMTEIFGTSDSNEIDTILADFDAAIPAYVYSELSAYFLGKDYLFGETAPSYDGFLDRCRYVANYAATGKGVTYAEIFSLIYGVSVEQAQADLNSIFGAVSDAEINAIVDDYLYELSYEEYDSLMSQLQDEDGYMLGYSSYITLFQLAKAYTSQPVTDDTNTNTNTNDTATNTNTNTNNNNSVIVYQNTDSGKTTNTQNTDNSVKNPATGVEGVGAVAVLAAASALFVALTAKKKSK